LNIENILIMSNWRGSITPTKKNFAYICKNDGTK